MKRLTATLAILFFITAACTNAQDKKKQQSKVKIKQNANITKEEVNTKTAKKCRLNKSKL